MDENKTDETAEETEGTEGTEGTEDTEESHASGKMGPPVPRGILPNSLGSTQRPGFRDPANTGTKVMKKKRTKKKKQKR